MNNSIETEFLTPEDAAALLDISKRAFNENHSKRIAYALVGKRKRYPKGELIKYMNSLIQPAARPLEANV
jgi:hypothetical protein